MFEMYYQLPSRSGGTDCNRHKEVNEAAKSYAQTVDKSSLDGESLFRFRSC